MAILDKQITEKEADSYLITASYAAIYVKNKLEEGNVKDAVDIFTLTLNNYNKILEADYLREFVRNNIRKVQNAFTSLTNGKKYLVDAGYLEKGVEIKPIPEISEAEETKRLAELKRIEALSVNADIAKARFAELAEYERQGKLQQYLNSPSFRRELDDFIFIFCRNVTALIEILESAELESFRRQNARLVRSAVNTLWNLRFWTKELLNKGVQPFIPAKLKEFNTLEERFRQTVGKTLADAA